MQRQNSTKRKPATNHFPPALAATIREPLNVQQDRWELCLKSQFNSMLSEKIRKIIDEHTHGEKMLVKHLLIAWAGIVNLKEHFPGISDKLCPEIPYYLDYCDRLHVHHSMRRTVVQLVRAIVTHNIQQVAVIYADWRIEVAREQIRQELRLSSQDWHNAAYHIRQGDTEKALDIIAASLRDQQTKRNIDENKSTSKPGSHNITRLRDQLRKLQEEGEAHNESGIFRLERMIYDLEHEVNSASDAWPEVIGDE